jgi:hypothetical protein
MTPREIINYWMAQPEKRLFSVDPDFDAELTETGSARCMHKPWQAGWQTGKTPLTGGWRWCCCSTR